MIVWFFWIVRKCDDDCVVQHDSMGCSSSRQNHLASVTLLMAKTVSPLKPTGLQMYILFSRLPSSMFEVQRFGLSLSRKYETTLD